MKARHGSVPLHLLLHAAWSLTPVAASATSPLGPSLAPSAPPTSASPTSVPPTTTAGPNTALPVPFRLEYRAPPGCPDETSWLRELTRRSSRVVLARDPGPAPSLRVTLSENDDGVRAELLAVDVDGRETNRTLRASTCAEAAQGSAWVSALWLDPSASGPSPPDRAVSANVPPPPPSSPETSASRPPAVTPAPRETTPRAHSASLLPMQLGASAQLGDFFTALPDFPIGFAGFLELRAWRRSVVAPVVRVGYVSAGSGIGTTARGKARVSLATMRTVGCVFAWPRESVFRLQPCAVWELGRLRGSGEDTSAGSTANATWHGVGALGRATLEIFPLVSLDAEAGLIAPLQRDRFVFGPAPVVSGYATPAVAGTFSLGFTIGARLAGRQPPGP